MRTPAPGTRVWVGAPPSKRLSCAICYEIFTQARTVAHCTR
jgi:hypothetical protein